VASDVGPTVGVLGGKSRSGKGGVFDDQFAALDGSVWEASISVETTMASDKSVVWFSSDVWVVCVAVESSVGFDPSVALVASDALIVSDLCVVCVGRRCVGRSNKR